MDTNQHDQAVEELNKALAHFDMSLTDLVEILKSDSVYTILRFGVKSPSRSGMDNCEDNHYSDLYRLVERLKLNKVEHVYQLADDCKVWIRSSGANIYLGVRAQTVRRYFYLCCTYPEQIAFLDKMVKENKAIKLK